MITSTNNKKVKWVRLLQSARRARQAEQKYVIEGTRLIEEAMRAGCRPELVFYTPEWGDQSPRLLAELQSAGLQLESLTEDVFARCSDVEAPQGVLAVLPIEKSDVQGSIDLVLVLDRLADPGNVGTLLRTALAANVGIVYLTPGTVDPYNPKVVRAAMGAHFYLGIEEATTENILQLLSGFDIWAAEARQGNRYDLVDWRAPIALAIGSEAHGLDMAINARATGRVQIPISPLSESLNAAMAAAIILFEIQRQRGL